MTPRLFPVSNDRARLYVSERPRGGHWLGGDLAALRASCIDVLVSALPLDEAARASLGREAAEAHLAGLAFVHLPLANLLAPSDEAIEPLRALAGRAAAGEAIAVHCWAGIGRSPLIVASILVLLGESPDRAWAAVERARGRAVPDTQLQRRWVGGLAVYSGRTHEPSILLQGRGGEAT